ncbi:MAG: hypothetical protein AAF939_07075 [Planctomycetota bacterium]
MKAQSNWKHNSPWIVVFLLTFSSLALFGLDADGDDFLPEKFTAAQVVEYERQLNAILKTSRDEERIFIAQLVIKIREGKIPSKLANTSFQWIMQKRPDTNYRFIYFVKVLQLQARAINVDDQVPPFDFSVYTAEGQRTGSQIQSSGQNASSRFRFLNRFQLRR